MSESKIITLGSSSVVKHIAADKACPKTGTPFTNTWNYFDHSSGNFRVGIWDSTAGSWEHDHPQLEFCYIVEGSVEITEEDGGIVHTFDAGSSFVVPKGLRVTWNVKEYAKKILVAAAQLEGE